MSTRTRNTPVTSSLTHPSLLLGRAKDSNQGKRGSGLTFSYSGSYFSIKKGGTLRFLVLSALTLAAFFTAQAGELNIVEIKRPLDVEEAGQYFSPKCIIENAGQSTEIALVTCRIIDRRDMSQVYYDAMSSYPLDPGATTIEFDEFVPEGGGKYNAKFTVQSQFSADSREKNFSASGYDITPVELISPSEWPISVFDPAARFEERAGEKMDFAWLNCKIELMNALGSPLSTIYEDSINHTFEPYEVYTAVFPEAQIPYLSIKITFWAQTQSRMNISNPPLVVYFSGVAEESGPESNAEPSLVTSLDGNKASIRFTLAKEGEVSLDIYDVSGKRVADVVDARLGAGEHEAAWNIEDVSRGVYFVRLATGETVKVSKLVIGY